MKYLRGSYRFHVYDLPGVRLVQLSDLHFGHPSRNGEGAHYERLWTRGKWTGLLGHDDQALTAAEAFLRQQREEHDDVRVVMTGDHTSHGHPDQFGYAEFFLGGTGVPTALEAQTLADDSWRDRVIPGNHDRWPGHEHPQWPGCTNGPSWPGYFAACGEPPYVRDPIDLDGTWSVRLMGIDTDGDVGEDSMFRGLAIGHFPSELEELASRLDSPEDGEVRVLLLHHCREVVGVGSIMTPKSKGLLDRFVRDHRIHVLMSGHVHKPLLALRTIEGRNVIYSRCGTSSQQSPDRLEKDFFRGPLASVLRKKKVDRSLMSHEVEVEPWGVTWRATDWVLDVEETLFERSASKEFVFQDPQNPTVTEL